MASAPVEPQILQSPGSCYFSELHHRNQYPYCYSKNDAFYHHNYHDYLSNLGTDYLLHLKSSLAPTQIGYHDNLHFLENTIDLRRLYFTC